MNAKTQKIIYWVATGAFSAMMLMSAFMYLTMNPELVKGFNAAGLPLYLVYLLGVAKFLGVVGLLVPGFPKIREWAYAGYTFNLLGAAWVHISTSTAFAGPLIFLVVLGVSYYFNVKIRGDLKVS